jgi:hypothetical protein
MDANDVTSPSVDDGDQKEFELTGDQATAQWRQMRRQFSVGAIVSTALVVAAWLLWHRSASQMTWVGLGLGAANMAMLIWRHDLIGFSYTSTGGDASQASFVGRRSPVPRELASPALLLAAALLFLAATSTGFGRWLASVFGVLQTLHDAGESVGGLIATPLAIIFMLVFAVVGVGIVGSGLFSLARFVLRGFRSDPDNGSGLGLLAAGLFFLAVVAFMAYSIIWQRDQMFDVLLEPFRTIWGWFH